jgi:hypothetical protein
MCFLQNLKIGVAMKWSELMNHHVLAVLLSISFVIDLYALQPGNLRVEMSKPYVKAGMQEAQESVAYVARCFINR